MTRTMLLAALVALLAFAASGCGSSGSGDEGVAAIDTGTSASGSGSGSTTPQQTDEDPQEAALKWARCMRASGVDVPDPQVDADGRVQIRPGARGFRPGQGDQSKFQAAVEKCGTPLGNVRPQLTEAQREQLQETMLSFAKCMRQHGVDMPDPDFSGGGGLFRIGGPGRGGVDPSDPDFQAAQKVCEPIMQDLRGGFRTSGGGSQ